MKSKYIKIFMIFAIAFTLLSALFVSPNVAFAASEDETIEYDLDSIEAQTPTSAILSFPVTWQSVYGNEITWSSNNENIIKYDEEAHWMVVYREKVTGESATVVLTVTVKNGDKSDSREIEVIVPAGKTATRTFTITYVNAIPEAEEGIELDKEYNLGDPTYVLPKLSYVGKAFMGWFVGDTKVEKILVGSMQDYTLTAKWEDRAISSISAVANDEFTALQTPAANDFTVTANYNDGTSETITSGYTVSSDKLHVGTTSVTVTCGQLTANANVTVNPIVLTTADIILSEKEEITYDGAEHSFTKFNNNFEGLNVTLEGEKQTNATGEAGAKFTVNVEAQEGYEKDYTLPFVSEEVALVINKAELNVTVPSQSIEAGTEPSWNVEDFTISGLVSADESKKADLFERLEVKYLFNSEYTEQLTAGKTYNVEFSLDLDNYTVAFNDDVTLTIKTATGITFKADQGPVTYNGQSHTFTASAYLAGSEEALVGTFTYDGESQYSQKDVAKTTVNITFVHATYGTIKGTVDFEVIPMQVTVSVDDAEGVYGNTPDLSEVSINYGGILEADIKSFEFVLTTNAKSDSSVGNYSISATYTSNSNYNVLEVKDGTYKVNPRDITVKPTNATSVYGEEISVMGYEVVSGSIVNDDKLSIEFTTTATSSSDAGKYSIELVEAEYTNYTVALDESQVYEYEITPKDLSNETLDITLNGSDWNVQSETHRPTLTVKYGDLTITSYTPTYSIDSAQTIVNGDQTITITFNGNYTGSKEVTYYVTTNGMAAVKGETLNTEMSKLTLDPISELTELPTIEGTSIVWTADVDAVTVVNNKVYLFNPTQNNITVTLTAYISYGTSSSDIREYTVVVEPTTVEETLTSNGVSVTVPTKEQLELFVELVATEDQGNYTLSAGESSLAQYNISFTQYGEAYTSFASAVTVKLPVPEGYTEGDVIRIYHVTDGEVDSTYIEPTKIENGYIYFEATQFSPYIVVKYKEIQYEPAEATITFDADKTNRTEYSTQKQVWSVEGLTLTNEKASSTTNVGDYSNPVRFYKGSSITIKASGKITKIIINAGSTGEFSNPWEVSIGSPEGSTVESDGTNYTITFSTPVEEFVINATAQIRAESITVTYLSVLDHAHIEQPVEKEEATCTENGHEAGSKCSICDKTMSGMDEIPATGHSYGEWETVTDSKCTTKGSQKRTCSVCGAVDSQELALKDHEYGEWVVEIPATCGTDGKQVKTCGKCSDTIEEVISATGEHNYSEGKCTICEAVEGETPQEPTVTTLATFEFGANGSASHSDGSNNTSSSSYTETVGGYTLSITGDTNMYTGARDATGNSCIKFGASSKAGSMSFTVPENVTEVIIYVAKYKSYTTKVTINGTTHTLTKNSNDGAYDEIRVDTTTNKTITFTTVSGGYRAMLNTIVFNGTAK